MGRRHRENVGERERERDNDELGGCNRKSNEWDEFNGRTMLREG